MDGFNINNYLRISLTDVVLVCISTLIIVCIAKHFFWDKLLNLIAKRQQLIQDNIDSSLQIKEEAMQVKSQYDEKLKNAGLEAHDIVESAKQQANQEKQRILQETQADVAKMKQQAQEDIERDKLHAQKEMKDAISSVALQAASQLVQKEMNEQTQKEFVDDFIDKAGKSQW